MKRFLCLTRDVQAETYSVPLCFPNKGAAVRAFCDELVRKDVNGNMQSHPADFELHEAGWFDDQTGLFNVGSPVLIIRGSDALAKS